MFQRVYEEPTAAGQKHVAVDVIRRLVDHHLAHPELIPATYRDTEADPVTQVVDHVSGMTDRFALAMHDRLFDSDAAARMTPLLRS
jgi:dGTPase